MRSSNAVSASGRNKISGIKGRESTHTSSKHVSNSQTMNAYEKRRLEMQRKTGISHKAINESSFISK